MQSFPFRYVVNTHGKLTRLETDCRDRPGFVYLWDILGPSRSHYYCCLGCAAVVRRERRREGRVTIRMTKGVLHEDPDNPPRSKHICEPRLFSSAVAERIRCRLLHKIRPNIPNNSIDLGTLITEFLDNSKLDPELDLLSQEERVQALKTLEKYAKKNLREIIKRERRSSNSPHDSTSSFLLKRRRCASHVGVDAIEKAELGEVPNAQKFAVSFLPSPENPLFKTVKQEPNSPKKEMDFYYLEPLSWKFHAQTTLEEEPSRMMVLKEERVFLPTQSDVVARSIEKHGRYTAIDEWEPVEKDFFLEISIEHH